jgi:hypothetical protein
MPAVAAEPAFKELEGKIKNELLRGLKMKTVAPEEIMAILFIFSQAETHEELKLFCAIFENTFTVLHHVIEGEQVIVRENIEERVKAAVSRLVHTNPLLATKIAKAAVRPGITWEELVSEFPELQQ